MIAQINIGVTKFPEERIPAYLEEVSTTHYYINNILWEHKTRATLQVKFCLLFAQYRIS